MGNLSRIIDLGCQGRLIRVGHVGPGLRGRMYPQCRLRPLGIPCVACGSPAWPGPRCQLLGSIWSLVAWSARVAWVAWVVLADCPAGLYLSAVLAGWPASHILTSPVGRQYRLSRSGRLDCLRSPGGPVAWVAWVATCRPWLPMSGLAPRAW